MDKTTTSVAICFFVLLVLGMAVYTVLEKREQVSNIEGNKIDVVATSSPATPPSEQNSEPLPLPEPPPVASAEPVATDSLRLVREVIGDTHYITGTYDKPTPCHELSNEVDIMESYPEQVRINFTTTTTAEMCAQVISPEPVAIEVRVSERATFAVYDNGKLVSNEF